MLMKWKIEGVCMWGFGEGGEVSVKNPGLVGSVEEGL